MRELTTLDGRPANAIYGFLSMIVKLLKDKKPEYLVFCYDLKEPSFRRDLYSEYKANRSEMPIEMAQQMGPLKSIAGLLGIPEVEAQGFEADDCIGTLAKLFSEQDFEVLIVSGDKDFAQLVSSSVKIYDTMKDIIYDPRLVVEKWGVPPEQFIDYLALIGDSSDNIPGVAGIGPKSAEKLLKEYTSLEEIYANLENIKPDGVQKKLSHAKEMAFLSKTLVTISCDVPLSKNPVDYHLKNIQRDEFKNFLENHNFKSMIKSLASWLNFENTSVKTELTVAETHLSVAAVAPPAMGDPLANARGSLRADDTLSGLAPASVSAVNSVYVSTPIQLLVDEDDCQKLLDAGDVFFVFECLSQIYVSDGASVARMSFRHESSLAQKKLKGFDLKNLARQLKLESCNVEFDLQVAAYVVHAENVSSLAMIAARYLNREKDFLESPQETVSVMLALEKFLRERLHALNLEKVYHDVDGPLIPVLFQMEKRGVLISTDLLQQQSGELAQELSALEKEIYLASDGPFNILSPKQLGQILFDKLKIPTQKKTKTGFSTDNEVLEKIEHPLAKLVLSYRELSKLKSTYVDSLGLLVDPQDLRIHSHFNQALTTTGRLSSENPNLQNIPVRTERGQRVRKAFVAEPNMLLGSVDYSQIELRILAHYSQDPGLIEAFMSDQDIHQSTAAKVFKCEPSSVTPELRRIAKAINFGIAYGQGVFGLAETLGIPRDEAKQIIEEYFKQFSGVRAYIQETTKQAYEQGYVETLIGRRRYLAELTSKNQAIRKFGERAAINAPIQGTASDLVKIAMIQAQREIPVPMILQVHDELIFEASEQELLRWKPKIIEVMENIIQLRVPLKVNFGMGSNWDEAH